MSVLFTDECRTVGDLLNWIKENDIPAETEIVVSPTLDYMVSVAGAEYQPAKNGAGTMCLML